MGYTHYFQFTVPKGIKAAVLEAKYQTAIKECAKLTRVWNREASERNADEERLSGFTAHTKPGQYGGLEVNGKGENAHESFDLREHFKQNIEADGAFGGSGFCKTARKPYDAVIVACLAVLKYRLGNAIQVSSDGRHSDWTDGVAFARRVLRRAIPNPIAKPDAELVVENGRKLVLVKK